MSEIEVQRKYDFLGGVRIVDCSVSVMGAFATQLLAGYGADATSLRIAEVMQKDATPFADLHLRNVAQYSAYLDRHNDIVEADLEVASDSEKAAAILGEADVIVVDFNRTLDLRLATLLKEIVAANPDVIIAHLSPYGSGEREGRRASDLTLYHGGGPGFATPGLVSDPRTMAPLRPRSHQGHFVSGLTAAINIASALLRKQAGGERIAVDFSAHEAMANVFRQNLCTYAFHAGGIRRDLAKGRGAGGTADQQNLRCRDGWVNLNYAGIKQWEALREMLEQPTWMEDDRFATPSLRYRNWAVITSHLTDWLADRSKEEVFFLAQAFGIPSAPVNTGTELLEESVLKSRGFWDGDGPARVPAGPALVTFPRDRGE